MNVNQAAHHLSQNDITVMSLIKTCKPADIYGTQYLVQEINVAVAMVKDIYTKKLEPHAAIGTTPLSMHHTLNTKSQNSEGTNPRVTFNEANLFDNARLC